MMIPHEKCLKAIREMEQEKKYIFHLLRFFLSNRHFNGGIVTILCTHFTISKTISELLFEISQGLPSGAEQIEIDQLEATTLKTLLLGFEESRRSLLDCNVSTELH